MTREEAINNVRSFLRQLTEGCQESIRVLIPELKESEDERIRKEILECIETLVKQPGASPRLCNWIAWLEKQKEPQELPLMNGDADLYFDNWNQHNDSSKRGCFNEGIRYAQRLQKEQKSYWKPTEIDVALFNKAVTTNKTLTPAERAQLDIIRSKFGYCRATNCSGIAQEEQKLAEWSEEDEEMLGNIFGTYKTLEDMLNLSTEQDRDILESMNFEKDWLKNRFKSFRPQPPKDIKFEPKEGDIVVNRDGVIAVFDCWGHHPDGGSCNDHSYFFAKCTLDDNCYDEIDCHPDSFGLRYATLEEIRKLVPYLLASSQPHWKPSEEQMEALAWYSENSSVPPTGDKAIKSLYNDLKKL